MDNVILDIEVREAFKAVSTRDNVILDIEVREAFKVVSTRDDNPRTCARLGYSHIYQYNQSALWRSLYAFGDDAADTRQSRVC